MWIRVYLNNWTCLLLKNVGIEWHKILTVTIHISKLNINYIFMILCEKKKEKKSVKTKLQNNYLNL